MNDSDLFDERKISSPSTARAYREAIRICQTLHSAGHVAYFAGGCVRDSLLGRTPKDFDVATDATPDRVREIFGRKKTLAFGASFGVIGVLSPEKAAQATEVATFRSDGEYSDGRRPDHVHFGDPEQDAMRRDFTVNGLFYDPAVKQIIDYVGGQDDLASQRLRTIGHAAERFDEDKLRMLRAVRFATTLGFELDSTTKQEIIRHASEISVVSAERVGAEMRRVVCHERAAHGLKLLHEYQLVAVFPMVTDIRWPSLEGYLVNRESGSSEIDFESSLALVIHSVPADPFLLLKDLSSRWRLSNEERRRIEFALRNHSELRHADQHPRSQWQRLAIHRDAEYALRMASSIVAAEGDPTVGVETVRGALEQPRQVLDPPPLIDGRVLSEAGYQPGRDFRIWLERVRNAQLDGEIESTEQAMELVKRLASGEF